MKKQYMKMSTTFKLLAVGIFCLAFFLLQIFFSFWQAFVIIISYCLYQAGDALLDLSRSYKKLETIFKD